MDYTSRPRTDAATLDKYAGLLSESLRDTDYPAWKARHDAFLASLGDRKDEVRNEYERQCDWEQEREESQR